MSEFATLYLEEIPADETTGEGVTEVEAHDGQDGPAETAEPEGGAAAEAGAGGTKKKKKKKRRGRKRAELKWGCRSVHGDPRPAGRGGSALALCDGQLYLFGGANLRSAHFSDTWAFDPRTRTWELLFRNGDWTGPSARSGHSCTVLGRKVVLFGGAELSNAAAVYNDAHVFDTETRAWARLAVEGEPPSPRNGHTAVAVDDHTMAVFGGSSPEDGQFNDLYTLQLDRGGSSGRWAKVEWDGEGPAERDLHAAAASRGASSRTRGSSCSARARGGGSATCPARGARTRAPSCATGTTRTTSACTAAGTARWASTEACSCWTPAGQSGASAR